MGQRLLLVLGAAMLVAAIAIGGVTALQGGWSPTATGFGMMGGYARPGGMMGGAYGQAPVSGTSVSIDQAQQSVQQYLDRYGSSDLVIDEVIEFQDNFYAIVKEKSTGTGAFEVLVNKVTGAVGPEPGPNMMWNTKYGMMAGGMMGFALPSGAMTVSKDKAGQIAQSWLDANQSGAKIEEPDTFYGYYTVHFTKDGKVAGMLSVNGYSGQVWYHTWHGAFVQEKQVS